MALYECMVCFDYFYCYCRDNKRAFHIGHQVLVYAKDVRELLCTTDECNLFESGDSPFKLLREEEAGQLGRGPAYPPRHLHTEDGAHGQTVEERECIPMRDRPWISRV